MIGNDMVPTRRDVMVREQQDAQRQDAFLETLEYRRFVEFCDACRRYRCIGICYGTPGVGKTQSARSYAQWDVIEPLLTWQGVIQPQISPNNPIPHVALYTPPTTTTPKRMEQEILLLRWCLRVIGEAAYSPLQSSIIENGSNKAADVEVLLIDEVNWLKPVALELLRGIYDRSSMGLILIGMPGIEKSLTRYPQLYSRVGFVHQFRTLGLDEQRDIVTKQLRRIAGERSQDHMVDQEAVASVIRMTQGNFRMMQRLLEQVERIMCINEQIPVVKKEVVETARKLLVLGR